LNVGEFRPGNRTFDLHRISSSYSPDHWNV
jgi:hypothetical protein